MVVEWRVTSSHCRSLQKIVTKIAPIDLSENLKEYGLCPWGRLKVSEYRWGVLGAVAAPFLLIVALKFMFVSVM